jgi:hypothetical protein
LVPGFGIVGRPAPGLGIVPPGLRTVATRSTMVESVSSEMAVRESYPCSMTMAVAGAWNPAKLNGHDFCVVVFVPTLGSFYKCPPKGVRVPQAVHKSEGWGINVETLVPLVC